MAADRSSRSRICICTSNEAGTVIRERPSNKIINKPNLVVRLPQVLLLEEPKGSERCVKLDLNKSYALQAGKRNVQKQVLAVGSVP